MRLKKNFYRCSVFGLLCASFLFLVPCVVFGAEASTIVINEIAWMGTKADANDEWIELYNPTEQEVDLKGWMLQAVDGQPKINLIGKIGPKSYFLLERTSDQTIKNIAADQIYTGSLENGGEILELRDVNKILVDSIDCSKGWFAGDNQAKKTMERKDFNQAGNDSANWVTNNGITYQGSDAKDNIIFGTPKVENSISNIILVEQPIGQNDSVQFLPDNAETKPEVLKEALPEQILVEQFKTVAADDIKNLELGARVKVVGVVVVEPGVLGENIFYLDGSQIYSSKKDFPELKLGDKIEVQGVISESAGEKRIKISTQENIKIVERGLTVEPLIVSPANLNFNLVGRLIKISGEVIEKTGQKIYLASDKAEAIVYLKESVKITGLKIKEGDKAEITGILSRYDNELRLLPRSKQDIKIVTVPSADISQKNEKILL